MGGRQVYAYFCKKGESLNREFQVRLAPGLYQCILTGENCVLVKKLVIQ